MIPTRESDITLGSILALVPTATYIYIYHKQAWEELWFELLPSPASFLVVEIVRFQASIFVKKSSIFSPSHCSCNWDRAVFIVLLAVFASWGDAPIPIISNPRRTAVLQLRSNCHPQRNCLIYIADVVFPGLYVSPYPDITFTHTSPSPP